MAGATPVLERKSSDKEESAVRTYRTASAMSDEAHNARIKDNYARLINPDNKIEDIFAQSYVAAPEAAPVHTEATAEPVAARPYLVENARADADIFRADSAINRASAVADVAAVGSATVTDTIGAVTVVDQAEEDENEDLRPTKTTIQYRTVGETDKVAEQETAEKRGQVLGKKEKIIIATFVSLVIVLFSLVIINSAIIANFESDIAAIQNGIQTVKSSVTAWVPPLAGNTIYSAMPSGILTNF